MTAMLLLEQLLNGVQFSLMLFLLALGVTLIFGVMGLVNIAHGSLFMLGACFGFTVGNRWGFALGLAAALAGTALVALFIEALVMRRLYRRSHLDQVLGTFGLMLICNELVVMVWGREPLLALMPQWLSGAVVLPGGLHWPAWRLAISAVAIVVGLGVWLLVTRTRLGMLVRAGADKRLMVEALGVNIDLLFAAVFVLGAMLAALAAMMMGPLITIEAGVGEPLLILALVVTIVGGAGSLKGCLAASLAVGVVDTLARAWLSMLGGGGRAVGAMAVYWLMLAVLLLRPRGLFAR